MKYKFKAPKLKPKWLGPYIMKHGFPSGYVELYDSHGESFIVNGHRVKLYYDMEHSNKISVEYSLESDYEEIESMAPDPNSYKETRSWTHKKDSIDDITPDSWEEIIVDKIDKTRKGILVGNVLYVPKYPNKKPKTAST